MEAGPPTPTHGRVAHTRVRDSGDPVVVIGCSLAKAVLNAQHLEQIRDGVERTHHATVLATELLNLHARRVLEGGEEVPDFFSGNWTWQAWVAVSTIDGQVDTSLRASRQEQVALHGDALAEVDSAKTTQLFKFAADQFASTAATNLQLHLRKRVGAYVNMSFAVDKDAWAAMARTERHAHKLKKRRLHWDVCRIDTEARKLTDKEKAFMASHSAQSKRGAAKAASSAHGGQHHVDVAITLHDHDLATFHGDSQKALLQAMHGHVDPKGKVRSENGASPSTSHLA